MMSRLLGALVLMVSLGHSAVAQPTTSASAATRTRNVVLVVTDGLRWQEVFGGADSSLLFDPARVGGDTVTIRRAFWMSSRTARREALLPFLWGVVAREGQL
jgi:hypothetical protein